MSENKVNRVRQVIAYIVILIGVCTLFLMWYQYSETKQKVAEEVEKLKQEEVLQQENESTEDDEGIYFEEETVEVDYNASPEEILSKYTEEGMRIFKMNFPDTLTMNYALKNIGKEPVEIKGKTMDGDEVSLSNLEGKKMIISFAKTTCSICKEMIPVLEEIKSKHEDITFLNIFPVDDNKSIESFYKEFKLDVPPMTLSLEDNKDLKSLAIDDYKVDQVPTYVFVDEYGKISYTYIGNKDEVLFEEMIIRAFEEEKLYDYLRTITKQVDSEGNEIKSESLVESDSKKEDNADNQEKEDTTRADTN